MIGAHLDLATLEVALAGTGDDDLEGDAHLRVWLHLGGCCPHCCGALEEVGAKEAVLERLSEPSTDPLRAALRRWVLMRRGQPLKAPRITPTHLYWLERSRREGGCLARLAIEEARNAVRLGRDHALHAFERLVDELADPALLALGAERWQGLRAVAHAYLGHVLLRAKAPDRGLAYLQHADQALALVGPNPEVRAVVLMVRAEVDADRGEHGSSFDLLGCAEAQLERLAEAVWSPGHWAALRLQQAQLERFQPQGGRYSERLAEALRLTPPECLALRVQCASWLCLAQLEAGEIEQARESWEIVEAGRSELGLRGSFHDALRADFELFAGRLDAADACYRRALEASRQTGDTAATLHAIHGLMGSRRVDGDRDGLERLAPEIDDPRSHREGVVWRRGDLERQQEIQVELGLMSPGRLPKELSTAVPGRVDP